MGLATNIREYLAQDLFQVACKMSDSLSCEIELLNTSNAYILSNSGKMIRPIVAILMARLCGVDSQNSAAINFAVAIELLHNATLLHDDVADDSPLRRGKPTIMAKMGPRASVLIGDYWLVKSIDSIIQMPQFLPDSIQKLSKTLSDLAMGEMLQLEKATKGDTSIEEYLQIIYYKTVSLFEATAITSAMASQASEAQARAIVDYVVNLGYAFQIKDDLLDYSDSEITGKPVGTDLKEAKMTLPLLLALENLDKEQVKKIRQNIVAQNNLDIEEIVKIVRENKGIERAKEYIENYVNKAIKALEIFTESKEKDFLIQIALYVAEREN